MRGRGGDLGRVCVNGPRERVAGQAGLVWRAGLSAVVGPERGAGWRSGRGEAGQKAWRFGLDWF